MRDVKSLEPRVFSCRTTFHRLHVTQSSALVWDIDQFEKVAGRFLVLRRNMAHILERRLHELEERSREIYRRKPSTVGELNPGGVTYEFGPELGSGALKY